MKLLARGGIDSERGEETVSVLPEAIRFATDQEDELFCPGIEDPPSDALIQSMRSGWLKGSTVVCVNRGAKGGEPIPYIVAGRSRTRAALIVNEERVREGLDPIRIEIVFCSADEAYQTMLLENNKQKRSPLFDARRWAHHKRVFARRLGKTSLNDAERCAARVEFAELVKCSESSINNWELLLEAHPDVLRLCETRQISAAAVKELVKTTPRDEQPAKAALFVKPRDAEPVSEPEPAVNASTAAPVAPAAKTARKARVEALGTTDAPKPISSRHQRLLLAEMRKDGAELDLVDPRVLLAWLLGETEIDGAPIVDHPSMVEVLRFAKRAGLKVAK
jgi:hypothetical protein